MKKNQKSLNINPLWILELFITIILILTITIIYKQDFGANSIKIVASIAIIMFINHILVLFKSGKKFLSFEFWFISLSYLFMFGQIFLHGLFNVTTIDALSHTRPVLDTRYTITLIYTSSLFIIGCIQLIFLFMILTKKTNQNNELNKIDYKLYITSKIMFLIGIPCHFIYSIRMISLAQTAKSYDSITEVSGLIDDFSNLMIYGIICLLFSKKLKKKTAKIFLLGVIAYLGIVMMLTGDRRYQTVSIIVILLSYLKAYNIKFSIKNIWLLVGGYLALGIFYLLREIRTNQIMTLFDFISQFLKILFNSDTNILTQTLYEFGGSIYTVCLAQKFIPSIINYKLGKTILSGTIAIFPFGFLYQDSNLFKSGRLAAELMEAGKTTVGGSIYSDLYGNFGFIGGLAVAAIIGLLFHFLFNKKHKQNKTANFINAKYYILFYALLHLVRASFTEVIRTSVWGITILLVIYNIKWSDKNEKQNI